MLYLNHFTTVTCRVLQPYLHPSIFPVCYSGLASIESLFVEASILILKEEIGRFFFFLTSFYRQVIFERALLKIYVCFRIFLFCFVFFPENVFLLFASKLLC